MNSLSPEAAAATTAPATATAASAGNEVKTTGYIPPPSLKPLKPLAPLNPQQVTVAVNSGEEGAGRLIKFHGRNRPQASQPAAAAAAVLTPAAAAQQPTQQSPRVIVVPASAMPGSNNNAHDIPAFPTGPVSEPTANEDEYYYSDDSDIDEAEEDEMQRRAAEARDANPVGCIVTLVLLLPRILWLLLPAVVANVPLLSLCANAAVEGVLFGSSAVSRCRNFVVCLLA